MDKEYMIKLANYRMPYGRYKDWLLLDLPEQYLIWYKYKGLPEGMLGEMLAAVYEIKLNGLEYLFKDYRNK